MFILVIIEAQQLYTSPLNVFLEVLQSFVVYI